MTDTIFENVAFVSSLSDTASASAGVLHKFRARSKLLFQAVKIPTIVFLNPGSNIVAESHQQVVNVTNCFEDSLEELLRQEPRLMVFTRYINPGWRMLRVVLRYPRRIIFEHNTVDSAEWLLKLRSLSWRDTAYILKTKPTRLWKEYIGPSLNEWLFGSLVMRKAIAGICISQSVADDLSSRCRSYRTKVIGNGIDIETVPVVDVDLSSIEEEINLLLVCGSPAPWTGADRLLRSFPSFDRPKIKLHMVGRFSPEVHRLSKRVSSNVEVKFHGGLTRDEIKDVASRCQLGVGSLGLHRLGMISGSTLKVGEFAAMGLPILAGYDETNFPRDYPYMLRAPSDESLLSYSEIFGFLKSLIANGFSSEQMREASTSLVSMDAKVLELADLLQEYVAAPKLPK